MSRDRFQFSAKVTKRDFGRMSYTVLFAPERIARVLNLAKHPRLRINGRIADIPFSGAFQRTGGDWYLILSKEFLREAQIAPGARVRADFEIADQDEVEVPGELMAELRRRTDALEVWEGLTAGRRRGLAHRVAAAKRPPTREKRILELIDYIIDGGDV